MDCPFLEQFYLGDSAAFEEWAIVKRERLQRKIRVALDHLIEYHEQRGEYQKACKFARQQVDLEPWSESAQRALMRTLALRGRRSAALKARQQIDQLSLNVSGVVLNQVSTRDLGGDYGYGYGYYYYSSDKPASKSANGQTDGRVNPTQQETSQQQH